MSLLTRRRVLGWGLGGVGLLAGGTAGAAELVQQGVLPGRTRLDQWEGACDVAYQRLAGRTPGPSWTGQLASRARRRTVNYTISLPPGHSRGDRLPLVVALHGYGGNASRTFSELTPAQQLAQPGPDGKALPPMAVVTVDGGGGYWHPHPGDDPLGMVVDELIPLCRRLGLGRAAGGIGVMGVSMGGFGALTMAERRPDLFRAVAAISPAVWLTYAESRNANPTAFTGPADFAAYDVVTHTGRLRAHAVRVASGTGDPFRPGVEALFRALPRGSSTIMSKGCHTGSFFVTQQSPSLAYLGARLSRAER